jgi:hypothetical protein
MKEIVLRIFLLVLCVLVLNTFFVKAVSQNISMSIQGKCKEYEVTLVLENFEIACYDVKIDVTTPAGRVGEIYDPRQGWKSSFFYIREDFCVEVANETLNKTYHVRANTISPKLYFAGLVRHGSSTWETGFQEVTQECPEIPKGQIDPIFWLVVLVVMVVILAGLVAHAKITRK